MLSKPTRNHDSPTLEMARAPARKADIELACQTIDRVDTVFICQISLEILHRVNANPPALLGSYMNCKNKRNKNTHMKKS